MVKLVCISDTHLAEPILPKGDILVHAGDFSYKGSIKEISKQITWLSKQKAKFKKIIVIPGNHDWLYEKQYAYGAKLCEDNGITILNDSGIVAEDITFWGSPITPFFHNWAFNRYRGEEIKKHWEAIPENTQVLIVHGPPKGILDGVLSKNKIFLGYDQHYRPKYKQESYNDHVGCEDLLERVKQLKQLKVVIFGHIHEGYGQEEHNGVRYINASIMNEDYQPVNKPIIVEI